MSARRPAAEAACFAEGQARAREYLVNGGERPPCPLRVSSRWPTRQVMAADRSRNPQLAPKKPAENRRPQHLSR